MLLDLAGHGLSIDPLASSTRFVDLAGDGFEHRTAWAGDGNGVLVLDADGDGRIGRDLEFQFAGWDPGADGDLAALRRVFDSNGNGRLDAGDARWEAFKVMVGDELQPLAALGIVSIDLAATGSGQSFADGSRIAGTASFTRSDGSTGLVGDAVLSAAPQGYRIARTGSAEGDGSTTAVQAGYAADGRLAWRLSSTRSADGASQTTSYDDDGDGIVERRQLSRQLVAADGSRSLDVADFAADGSLQKKTLTTQSPDGLTVVTALDGDGDGLFEESQVFARQADGSTTTVQARLAPGGALLDKVVTAASADGLAKTVRSDAAGRGVADRVRSETIVVAADGSRVATETLASENGTLLSRSVKRTSADGRLETVERDADGDGDIDGSVTISVATDAAGAVVTTGVTRSADGVTRGLASTRISRDGLSETLCRDIDGDGVVDRIVSDVTSLAADGARRQTVEERTASGLVLSQTVTATSADRKSIVIGADADGDGTYDARKTIVVAPDATTMTVEEAFKANGALLSKTVTTAAAGGSDMTSRIDVDGDGTVERIVSDVTTTSADGSRRRQISLTAGNGRLIDRRTVTTSADGLTRIEETDADGDGVFETTVTAVIALQGDGGRQETRSTTTVGGRLLARTVATLSADRRTTGVAVDEDGDGKFDRRAASVTDSSGQTTETLTLLKADGTPWSKTVTTVSGNGLSKTVAADWNGDGTYDFDDGRDDDARCRRRPDDGDGAARRQRGAAGADDGDGERQRAVDHGRVRSGRRRRCRCAHHECHRARCRWLDEPHADALCRFENGRSEGDDGECQRPRHHQRGRRRWRRRHRRRGPREHDPCSRRLALRDRRDAQRRRALDRQDDAVAERRQATDDDDLRPRRQRPRTRWSRRPSSMPTGRPRSRGPPRRPAAR